MMECLMCVHLKVRPDSCGSKDYEMDSHLNKKWKKTENLRDLST